MCLVWSVPESPLALAILSKPHLMLSCSHQYPTPGAFVLADCKILISLIWKMIINGCQRRDIIWAVSYDQTFTFNCPKQFKQSSLSIHKETWYALFYLLLLLFLLQGSSIIKSNSKSSWAEWNSKNITEAKSKGLDGYKQKQTKVLVGMLFFFF